MPTERTCRTCWHWGVGGGGQGLCGHPDTGGAVHGADDTCCNHLAIVGRGGDWQPHEQLSGGSSPAEDWTEPMVDASNSSTPSEEHVARHLLSGGLTPDDVEPDLQAIMAERDLLKQRVSELEAENAGLYTDLQAANEAAHRQQLVLGEQMTALALARRWAAARKRAAKIERQAVEVLAREAPPNCPPGVDPNDCTATQATMAVDCAACWAAWARARAEAGSE